ncbi:hypothetical protein CDAR_189511 [Caerostris darwini]|uniref:Uncharacterized protein n=1 Tax=Caerostris darwini TaxID=1538125 RepID=A0AAV4QWJ6_9ARAC|nr:hypothetical protein CDAR_189511 [Caerostris darwini]
MEECRPLPSPPPASLGGPQTISFNAAGKVLRGIWQQHLWVQENDIPYRSTTAFCFMGGGIRDGVDDLYRMSTPVIGTLRLKNSKHSCSGGFDG